MLQFSCDNVVAAGTGTVITFAATGTIGDYVELVSDGTVWMARGCAVAVADIAIA